MPTITAENRDAWQALVTSEAAQRPIKGTTVRITTGKFEGQTGTVTWHGVDAYYSWRYFDSAMKVLAQARGREGYRIRVQPETGDAFFTKAEYALVQHPTAS